MTLNPMKTSLPRPALLAVLALGLIAVAVIGFFAFRGDPAAPAPPPSPDAQGLAAADLDANGVVYQDGMHPWIVEDAPGKCPICGMNLVPTPVASARFGGVEIDPITIQNTGVRTEIVQVATLDRTVRTTGVFEADERAREVLTIRTSGYVERLLVRSEGERVRRGQAVLELYSPELLATQQELLLALRNRTLMQTPEADRLVEAARTRLRLFGVTDAQIARLEETGEPERTLTVHAPAGGTVTVHRLIEGQQVMAGETLLEIADLSRVWLLADVPEEDLAWVRPGVRAEVAVSGELEPRVGRVEFIYDRLDVSTRKGTARVSLSNPGHRLKPGMYATVTLTGGTSEPLPVVSAEAVVRTGTGAAVLIALGDGRFRPQPVTLGTESSGQVQVLEGLTGGEMIVTSAQFLIDSEARLSDVLQAFGGSDSTRIPAPPPHSHSPHP